MPEDHELLRDYARDRSESAFTELVSRHVDLVYSAALRETRGDGAMAEDITQAVFAELAGKASRLCSHPALAGWLYTCVRLMSANARRSNDRRHRREQEAHTMNELLSADSTESSWRQVEPVLDDAMHELSETDRAAVVLRFFEDRSHKEVGLALGVSETAARKRVDRALESLRALLARRGVTIGASGLIVLISTNAVQAAPVGLAVTISTAAAFAGTALATTATATATKAIAMTTLQKTVIGATLAIAVGAGIYETSQASRLRTQVQSLQQQQTPLSEQIKKLSGEREEASRQLAALRDEIERLSGNTTELVRLRARVAELETSDKTLEEPLHAEMRSWLERLNQLKIRLNRVPDQKIPELQFVEEATWLDVTRGPCDTDEEIRHAFSQLRNRGEATFAGMLKAALQAYGEANRGQFPAAVSDLKPYFAAPVDDSLLERFEVMPTEMVKTKLPFELPGKLTIVQRNRVDEELDQRWIVFANGIVALNPATEISVGPLGSSTK